MDISLLFENACKSNTLLDTVYEVGGGGAISSNLNYFHIHTFLVLLKFVLS